MTIGGLLRTAGKDRDLIQSPALSTRFTVGGQLPSSMVYTLELKPKEHWGYYGSLIGLATGGGALLGNLVGAIIRQLLNEDQLEQYGWRVAFWTGICESIHFYLPPLSKQGLTVILSDTSGDYICSLLRSGTSSQSEGVRHRRKPTRVQTPSSRVFSARELGSNRILGSCADAWWIGLLSYLRLDGTLTPQGLLRL